ncbi:hypothetical protein GCM10011588_58480 [Nocardia jinanensis]|uniref:Uncharacterized protein n=1 Tax=Nocardia jinanensis TaxID=382504 RepID=A0A917VWJ5_9NOCA|nr:hypothetical protein GCM10011588_58480 [Nocardia jinanensis]
MVPKRTAVTIPTNPVPVSVTLLSPEVGPEVGAREVRVGAMEFCSFQSGAEEPPSGQEQGRNDVLGEAGPGQSSNDYPARDRRYGPGRRRPGYPVRYRVRRRR